MAPEVLLGQPYSRPADVWSVGVVLYQLLTLARPYKASGLEELTEIEMANRSDDLLVRIAGECPLGTLLGVPVGTLLGVGPACKGSPRRAP